MDGPKYSPEAQQCFPKRASGRSGNLLLIWDTFSKPRLPDALQAYIDTSDSTGKANAIAPSELGVPLPQEVQRYAQKHLNHGRT